MINDINGIRTGLNPTTSQGSRVSADNAKQQPAAPAADSASAESGIQLSAEAQLLSRLEGKANAAPDIDQARVDSLREAIQNGSYEIDNSSLADSIDALEQLL